MTRSRAPRPTKLPLKLAVALLKDRNGVIDLGLPVTGSLDDPQFKLGPLIWKVVVNLVTKAATAPFALLGRLFGGGEQMNLIDFKPGSAALEPDEQGKLASRGEGDEGASATGARRTDGILSRSSTGRCSHSACCRRSSPRCSRRKPASHAHGKQAPAIRPDPAAALADPAEHFGLLAAEYRAELGKDAPLPESAVAVEAAKKKKGETPAYDPAIADLEKALLARAVVSDSDLENLGKKRARAIQDVLLGGGSDRPRARLSGQRASEGGRQGCGADRACAEVGRGWRPQSGSSIRRTGCCHRCEN